MASVLDAPHYHDETEAYKFVEACLWPSGPECPRCHETKRVGKMQGKSTRIGVYKCYVCRKPFNVKVGTVMEASNIKLHLWLQAFFLMCSSKKGCSANQLHRTLGIQLRSAWFLSMRIREAMRAGSLSPPLGSGGAVVEVDETFTGKGKFPKMRGGYQHKLAVLTLVERGGEARSFHIERADSASIIPIVRENIAHEAKIATDEAAYYRPLQRLGYDHKAVRHAQEEWVRGEVHSNTAESYFSVFKRGMRGTYQHCSERHLHRYLAEFDFRYNARIALGVNDTQRTEKALRGIKGRRLTYKQPVARQS